MEISQEQKEKIEEIGKKYHLKLILLHGSFATDKNKFASDLDIAVLGKKPIDFKTLLKIHLELAKIFGNSKDRELDVKSLHRADPLFCYYVARNSQLLFGNLSDYNEFRAYAFLNFYDSQDLFRLERRLISKFQTYLDKKYARC